MGAVSLSAKRRGEASVLDGLRQSGSLKALFPRATGSAMQAVLVNTAGGVTGGDRFDLRAVAASGTHLTVTTQAAERAYRAQTGQTGVIRNQITVSANARLNWMPQETILFDGCALRRSLQADLTGDARLLLVEPLVFGRTAMGERLTNASLHDRIDIRRDGDPIFLDAVALNGDIAAHLARPAIADGAAAMASVVYVAPDAQAHLDPVRALLPAAAGASLVRPDILVTRVLAQDSHLLRTSLMPILERLSGDALPRPWMI